MKKLILICSILFLVSCSDKPRPYSETAKLVVISKTVDQGFWATSDYSYCDSYKEENGKYLLFFADGTSAGEILIDTKNYSYFIKANYASN